MAYATTVAHEATTTTLCRQNDKCELTVGHARCHQLSITVCFLNANVADVYIQQPTTLHCFDDFLSLLSNELAPVFACGALPRGGVTGRLLPTPPPPVPYGNFFLSAGFSICRRSLENYHSFVLIEPEMST